MSDILEKAAQMLEEKLGGTGFDDSAKFDIEGEGTIVIDQNGVSVSDADTDVVMSASADTFQAILEGEMNPTGAYMTGKLTIAGNMGVAMKLAGLLS